MKYTDESLASEIESSPFHLGLAQHGELHMGFGASLTPMSKDPHQFATKVDPRVDDDGGALGMTTQEIADATNRVNGYVIKGKPC